MDKKKKSAANGKKAEASGKKAGKVNKKVTKSVEADVKVVNAGTVNEGDMDKSRRMKEAILAQYRSIRSFSIDMGIPYSTIVTALDRGIEGMAYGTVIRICDKLKMNPVDFTYLDNNMAISEQLLKNRVMNYYVKLNRHGQDRILELMDDFTTIDKYKA